jgi:hypothetical protein
MVRLFATRTFAHRLDPERKPSPTVTYREVHEAVDEIECVFRNWYPVITGYMLANLDAYHWEYALTIPWMSQERAFEIHSNRSKAGDDWQ